MVDRIRLGSLAGIAAVVPALFWTGLRDPFWIQRSLFWLLGSAAALAWLVGRLESGSFRRPPAAAWPWFLLGLVCVFSGIGRPPVGLALEKAATWILLSLLLWICSEMPDWELRVLRRALIAGAIFVCAYAMLQAAGGDPIDWQWRFGGRVFSSLGNPNFLAGYLLVVFPILFVEMGLVRGLGVHLGLAALTFSAVIGLGLSGTRGAWVAFLAAFLILLGLQAVWTMQRYPQERVLFRGSFWAALFLVSVFLFAVGRRAGGEKGFSVRAAWERLWRSPSAQERLFKWRVAREMIRDHPWRGVGAGHVKVNFALYQAKVRQRHPIALRSSSESNVHNDFLQIAAETGWPGLALFLAGAALFAWRMLRILAYLAWEDPPHRYLRVTATVAAGLAVFLYGGTNFPLEIPSISGPLFLWLGSAEALARPVLAVPVLRPRPVPRLSALLALGLIAGLWIAPPLRSQRFSRLAAMAEAAGDSGAAALLYEKAIRLDPLRAEKIAYELSEIYRRRGDEPSLEKAIRFCELSLSLRHYAEMYNNLGNLHFELARLEVRRLRPRASDSDVIRRMSPDRRAAILAAWRRALEIGLPDETAQKNLERNLARLERKE